jgi:predicted nuclease of predicted toxin-antitoxin system
MLFLIDEDVPKAVADFLRARGHTVVHILDVSMMSTQDEIVAAIGDDMRAIIVTCNARDFKALVQRVPGGNRARFRRLGLINLRCRQSQAANRVRHHIESIEFHFARVQARPDKRLMIDILNDKFYVHD